jgi:hypothetical protein
MYVLEVGDFTLVNRRKRIELNQQRNIGDIRRNKIHLADAAAGQLRNNLIAVRASASTVSSTQCPTSGAAFL